jgi:nicotinic acid phosphoribosyltransferase
MSNTKCLLKDIYIPLTNDEGIEATSIVLSVRLSYSVPVDCFPYPDSVISTKGYDCGRFVVKISELNEETLEKLKANLAFTDFSRHSHEWYRNEFPKVLGYDTEKCIIWYKDGTWAELQEQRTDDEVGYYVSGYDWIEHGLAPVFPD